MPIKVNMPQLQVTKNIWDKEFLAGHWDYLDVLPAERARSAIIGMYCRHFSPAGKILDVGCGLGTTVYFLNESQKKKYLGIDLSPEAVKKAKTKKVRFQTVDFADFQSKSGFNIVIFNEVLYYLDERQAIDKAFTLLAPNGKIVVSLYRMKNKRYDQKIWRAGKKLFTDIEAIEVTAVVKRQPVTWRIEVWEKK